MRVLPEPCELCEVSDEEELPHHGARTSVCREFTEVIVWEP